MFDCDHISASCKRSYVLDERYHQSILDRLAKGEASIGRGLNQETTLAISRDTRWGLHASYYFDLFVSNVGFRQRSSWCGS